MNEPERYSPTPDRNLRAPKKLKLPPGATDSHFHVYGPQARFPVARNQPTYRIPDSTLEDALALQKMLGFSRGVITQSYQAGYAYEVLLHALTSEPQRFRGIYQPAPDVTDGELEILGKAGIVGMRFFRRHDPVLDLKTLRRGQEIGWHCQFQLGGADDIAAWGDTILSLPGKFVLDNMAGPPLDRGVDSAEFRFVRKCLDTGRCWVKLTARLSKQETLPFSDLLPLAQDVIRNYPTRVVWGSDWPHPGYFKPMPNDADLVDLVADWAPDAATQRLIFVDNPAELFGFPPAA